MSLQTGSYSHAVNGVTLAGSFSQSASLDDTSSYSTSGSASASASGGYTWTPSGDGSDTLVTGYGNVYAASASSRESFNGWDTDGTQQESTSGSGSGNHTTDFTLSSGGFWQATSGSGTTAGSQTNFTGFSGSGSYQSASTDVDGDDDVIGGGSVSGSFSQNQGDTTSFNFNTTDSYSSGSGWQATSGSGSTADSGGSSFNYSGSGKYFTQATGASGTVSQNGAAQETFSYTKGFTVGSSGAWQYDAGAGSSSNGASGSGNTFSSYSGTAPYVSALSQFDSEVTGQQGISTALLPVGTSGSDTQAGNNNTSYTFKDTATYNGIDWNEQGSMTSSGSGATSDSFSGSASNFIWNPQLPVSFNSFDDAQYLNTSASATVSGSSSTSYSYTEHLALDDNGVWQNSSGSGAFSSSGSDNWSLSGSGDFSDEPYLNSASAASGTTSVSGSGDDSYKYTQNYNFLPTGQWEGISGSGSSSGTGSVTTGYSASGDYSGAYGAWDTDEYNGAGIEPNRSDLGQTGGPGIYAGIYGTDWSGSVSSSGSVTQSFGYSTTSNYTSADGWTSSGSASAENTGNTSASYSGSSPLSAIFNPRHGRKRSTMSGSASASGSDWSSYDYTQNSTLGTDGWQGTRASGSGKRASGGLAATLPIRALAATPTIKALAPAPSAEA